MKTPQLLKPYVEAGKEFMSDDAPQAAAALSFYVVSALPPMVVVILGLTGFFFNGETASSQFTQQLSDLLGPSVADIISTIIEQRDSSGHGFASLVGLVIILFSASGFFGQLQKALNQVWDVKVKPDTSIWITVKKRLVSMTAVLGTGFLFLVSLLLSTWISGATEWVQANLGIGSWTALVGQAVVSFLLVTALFAMIFKVLPDVQIEWKDVWKGAGTTAALFMVAKYGLAWYLGRSDLAASYGGAGALVLVLLWVYFSSMIMLYGAELTQVKARKKGRKLEPEPYAEKMAA